MMSPRTKPTNPRFELRNWFLLPPDQFGTDSEIPIGWIGRATDGLGQTDKKWRPIDRRKD